MAITADTVIYGNFYTVDKKQPKAQAAAIKDGVFEGKTAYFSISPKKLPNRKFCAQ